VQRVCDSVDFCKTNRPARFLSAGPTVRAARAPLIP
jgi:hypothetical protein